MFKKSLALGITLLFVATIVTPMTIGYNKSYKETQIYVRNIIESKIKGTNGFPFDLLWCKVHGSGTTRSDDFGKSVSISGDYAIIGNPFDYIEETNGFGSAYVFKRNGNIWEEQVKLVASNGTEWDKFGYSVSIDGDYAIIGAPGPWWNKGSAYIFKRNGNIWEEQAKLVASDGAIRTFFGWSVSIDGDYAIVGAPGEEDYGYRYPIINGSVYIFKRDGNIWEEQTKLEPKNNNTYDFGKSVSISGDSVIVGSPNYKGYSGAVYIFRRIGTIWEEHAKLVGSEDEDQRYLGRSVSIDGDYAIAGQICYLDIEKQVAYIFKRTNNIWEEQAKLFSLDNELLSWFGYYVSICGRYAIVSADGYDRDKGGSAYIFRRIGDNWILHVILHVPGGNEDSDFPWSVSIDESYAIAGGWVYGDTTSSATIYRILNIPSGLMQILMRLFEYFYNNLNTCS